MLSPHHLIILNEKEERTPIRKPLGSSGPMAAFNFSLLYKIAMTHCTNFARHYGTLRGGYPEPMAEVLRMTVPAGETIAAPSSFKLVRASRRASIQRVVRSLLLFRRAYDWFEYVGEQFK